MEFIDVTAPEECLESLDDNIQIEDVTLQKLVENLDQMTKDSKERRQNIERDFEDIKTRLDTNKQTLDNVKSQIEKVTGILRRLQSMSTENDDDEELEWGTKDDMDVKINDAKLPDKTSLDIQNMNIVLKDTVAELLNDS